MSDSFKILMLIKEIYSKSMCKIEWGLSESGLTHQQIMVLKLVAHNKEINISQLCNKMYLSKGTVSGIVNRLEQADYIKKVKYDNDKRNTYIQFSTKGFEFAKYFRKKSEETFENIFGNLNEEEKEEIIKSLNLLKNKLK
ncbi:MarR family winged helix-turn-helix transcriptional regulator [Paraclostridium ghonii]|uniref:DNA-binding MarR family transcriptional regulator n=1 Tax=Paraclostridium ghonii TaxID=29358 RepID=A0ABU0MXS0_9FIRM|nr:MarR family transcriptional regulator [Paeniclostridium ghonii]MDQ0555704.1 DNA-binding MarR family transcriptional regulator [Paeniclostridium ghonii]